MTNYDAPVSPRCEIQCCTPRSICKIYKWAGTSGWDKYQADSRNFVFLIKIHHLTQAKTTNNKKYILASSNNVLYPSSKNINQLNVNIRNNIGTSRDPFFRRLNLSSDSNNIWNKQITATSDLHIWRWVEEAYNDVQKS